VGVLNTALLKKVLITFAKSHQKDIGKLSADYAQKNYADLQAFAHKLKGSGATIGANALAKAAGVVEARCKEKKYDDCFELIEEAERCLKEVVDALQQLSCTEVNTTGSVMDKADLQVKAEKFALLSKTDLKNAEILLTEILAVAPTDPLAVKIRDFFDSFDMDTITPLLRQYCEKYQSPNPIQNSTSDIIGNR